MSVNFINKINNTLKELYYKIQCLEKRVENCTCLQSSTLGDYDDATLPLNDEDALLIRQGSDWREVSKNDLLGVEVKEVSVLPSNLEPDTLYLVSSSSEAYYVDSSLTAKKYSIISVGYDDLKPELKGTTTLTVSGTNVDIDVSSAAAYNLGTLTADTNINFINLQENKQVKLIVSGNVALTFSAENSVPVIIDNLSYNTTGLNIIIAEVSNIAGNLQINLMSIQ